MAAPRFGEKYVRACYNKFRRLYFADAILPDFDELDFEWSESEDEWGSVEWDAAAGNPALSLHPVTRLDSAALKATLLHEMIHIRLGAKYGHGALFWAEADRIHRLGAHREYF